MNTKPRKLVAASVLFASSLLAPAVKADLVYYLPFENSSGEASVANFGTAAGSATPVTGPFSGTAPGAPVNTHAAPTLGGAYSQHFAQAGTSTSAGALLLPNSADAFRLDSVDDRMTISTWVYWDGEKYSSSVNYTTHGIANTLNGGNGWALTITKDGELNFQYKNANGTANRKTAAGTIVKEGWYHVAVTWDSSQSSYALAFHVNGTRIENSAVNSAGYTGPGVLVGSTTPVALGASSTIDGNGSNGGGYNSLNGYLDDFAMWDTKLTDAQIRALYTAPSVITGYDAGKMNTLFDVFEAQGSPSIVGGLVWSYATGFDVTGKTLGDAWLGADGKYYLWLDGSPSNMAGMIGAPSSVPEPSAASMILGGAALLVAMNGRRPYRASLHRV